VRSLIPTLDLVDGGGSLTLPVVGIGARKGAAVAFFYTHPGGLKGDKANRYKKQMIPVPEKQRLTRYFRQLSGLKYLIFFIHFIYICLKL
jgi:uncharacterized protein (DUF2141 family)